MGGVAWFYLRTRSIPARVCREIQLIRHPKTVFVQACMHSRILVPKRRLVGSVAFRVWRHVGHVCLSPSWLKCNCERASEKTCRVTWPLGTSGWV